MKTVATLTRPSGRLPGSPRETVRNSLQFEGVTDTFHSTSPFLFFRVSAPRGVFYSLFPVLSNSLQFEHVTRSIDRTSSFYFSRVLGFRR
jgi:hypothetical protein